jgi:hypothetical protein
MNWLPRSAPLLLVLALLGCSTAPPGRENPRQSSPRVRCLSDPGRDNTEGTRPLFFLFCIESP